MTTKATLGVEQLERRDALNATVSLSNQGMLSIVDDAQGSLLTVSQVTKSNTPLVEVYNATLNSLADFYDEEIDTSLGRFVTLIEPILLVIMGLVIAGLLLSLYLPLFNLSSALR